MSPQKKESARQEKLGAPRKRDALRNRNMRGGLPFSRKERAKQGDA